MADSQGGGASIIFQWLERIGLGYAVQGFHDAGINQPDDLMKVRACTVLSPDKFVTRARTAAVKRDSLPLLLSALPSRSSFPRRTMTSFASASVRVRAMRTARLAVHAAVLAYKAYRPVYLPPHDHRVPQLLPQLWTSAALLSSLTACDRCALRGRAC